MPTLIDLTGPQHAEDPVARINYRALKKIDVDGFNVTQIITDSHAGTHMDAPLHMVAGGASIDQIDLSRCMGPARLLDLTFLKGQGVREIPAEALARYESEVVPGARLLIRTGWESEWTSPRYRTEAPYFSEEAAEWLVAHKVDLVGVDFPSVGPLDQRERLIKVHQILLGAGMIIVECLVNLGALPKDFEFIAFPMKYPGIDGSPVRAVAIV